MSNTNRNRRRRPASRPAPKKPGFLESLRRKHEFRPDTPKFSLPKLFHLTNLQRRGLLKWTLYALICVAALLIQDVIMSRIHISGATTDLAVCMILLIGLYEGTENGSLFALIGSIVYLFSGSSPGPYCIGLITTLTVGINLLRQNLWRRNFGSIVLCTGASIMVYEMGIFVIGLLSGLTIPARAGVFCLTGLFSCAAMVPMYTLVRSISKIGGDTWKE